MTFTLRNFTQRAYVKTKKAENIRLSAFTSCYFHSNRFDGFTKNVKTENQKSTDLHGNDGEDALERVHATRHKQHVLAPLGCNRNVPVSGVPDPDPDV